MSSSKVKQRKFLDKRTSQRFASFSALKLPVHKTCSDHVPLGGFDKYFGETECKYFTRDFIVPVSQWIKLPEGICKQLIYKKISARDCSFREVILTREGKNSGYVVLDSSDTLSMTH